VVNNFDQQLDQAVRYRAAPHISECRDLRVSAYLVRLMALAQVVLQLWNRRGDGAR
jgi:hypothetical protein